MSHLFILKVVSLVARIAARPVVDWIVHYKKQDIHTQGADFNNFLRRRCYIIGQHINYYQTKINRRMYNLPRDTIKLLPEKRAIDKGAEFIGEFILYSILLTLPVFEWIRASKESKEAEFNKNKNLRRIKNDMNYIKEENNTLKQKLEELSQILDRRISANIMMYKCIYKL